jgi:hypothetical protein
MRSFKLRKDWLAVAKGDQVQIDNYKSSCLAVKARFPKE